MTSSSFAVFSSALSAHACVAAAALLLAGCAVSAPYDACDGPSPALADCVRGDAWAECGGTERDPVFACGAGCLWFENGCVASGFVASSCPAENLCCVADFPYPADSTRDIDMNLANFISEWGTRPWDRVRERSVDVALTPVTPAPVAITCTGAAEDGRGPCGIQANGGRRYLRPDVFNARVRPNSVAILFWTLSIEVTRDADASLHARVCRLQSTDYASHRCYGDRAPACAVSGTLELAAFPEDSAAAESMPMHLTATFADGGTIDAVL